MHTVDDKTVTSGLRRLSWYASDWYWLLIAVGGVGCDFSQTRHSSLGRRDTHCQSFSQQITDSQHYGYSLGDEMCDFNLILFFL